VEEIGLPTQEVNRLKAEAVLPAAEEYGRFKPTIEGMTPEDLVNVSHAWQRREATGLAPEGEASLEALRGMSNQSIKDVNEIQGRLGLPLTAPRAEDELSRFLPHVLTEQAQQAAARARGFGAYNVPEDVEMAHRNIMTLAEPGAYAEGRIVPLTTEAGTPITSKLEKRYGFEPGVGDKEWMYTKGEQPQRGMAVDATTKELYESGMAAGREFVADPGAAYLANIIRLENKKAFLNFIERGLADRATGALQKGTVAHGAWLKKVDNPADMPSDWRLLKVPDLEGYAAPKWAANFIESRAKTLYNPNTPAGMAEELFDFALNRTTAGQLLKEGTGAWKRSVLGPFLGYYMGNVASNTGLQYAAGMRPWDIPIKTAQAVIVQSGKGAPILANMTNDELRREFATRGLMDWATMGIETPSEGLLATRKGFTRRQAEKLPEGAARTAGEAAATGMETLGKWNTKALQTLGGYPESNARIAVALDWLNKQGIKAPTATDLDRAAMFAKDAMIDYEAISASPTQKLMSQVMPFWAWSKGITSKAGEQALEHPERMASFSRALDTVFQPMSEEQRRVADPWVAEAGPTMGAFGQPYAQDKETGNPGMFMVGRFQPWGNLEQMFSRPGDYLAGTINPWIKGPIELMANRSSFKDKDIDEIAGSFPGNVLNPVIGRDYAKATTRPFGLALPASYEYTMSQLPGGRLANTLSEAGRAAGLWSDPYKAEFEPLEFGEWYVSGGKTYPFDYAKSALRRQREADKKAFAIKSKMRLASLKGDEEGLQFYQQELANHYRARSRALGYVDGDTEDEE
jgi:hypothetical protein